MTENNDGPTLDLTNTRALAEDVAAGFEANRQFRQDAFDNLLAYLETDSHLDLSLMEGYLYFAEEISADPDLFAEIVRQLALRVALAVERADAETAQLMADETS
ncbi:hypothetical protein [Microbacterium sp. UCD-TDU]|uniref:hypothetical protein n=1 Tax=Microbacterium sp. UCD-TDU TaxID=1247714 RepID=UPI000364A815|nr:hypothetical protein [Microbacterium sp. UCD-TDU]EYT59722.1 hypothetical protein D514_0108155 [Microbacterium sp. UCD-TDU]